MSFPDISFNVIFAFLLLVFGLILVINSFNKTSCPPPKVEYRLIPRTFKEQQESPIPLKDIFGSMFNNKNIIP